MSEEKKIYKMECLGETIAYAESLGFKDNIDDSEWDADMCDALEEDAIDYIESKGIKVIIESDIAHD
tara:strand:+ start:2495 stop:2695 length:201 start_codon:yes stop_codon:yes gene_type:complete